MKSRASRDTDLSVAEASLRLDARDDLDLLQVNLQPLVHVRRDLLFRAPRPALYLLPNSAKTRKQEIQLKAYGLNGRPGQVYQTQSHGHFELFYGLSAAVLFEINMDRQ